MSENRPCGWIVGLACALLVSLTGGTRAAGVKVRVVGEPSPRVGMFSTDSTHAKSAFLFADRGYKLAPKFPAVLDGKLYFELPIKQAHAYECLSDGDLYALAPANAKVDRTDALRRAGFVRVVNVEPFQLFGDDPGDVVGVFHRQARAGDKFELPAWTILVGIAPERLPVNAGGELLYNGIRLPREWPPRVDWSSDEPMPVPYLRDPPRVIPIDVGRQLFVDDFLIERTNLAREFHLPRKHEANPVLKPETPLERSGANGLAVASPKSGGLWWNPQKQLFELWYEAGWVSTIAYATSKDGLRWERPELPLEKGTNRVLPSDVKPDSWTVVRDTRAIDPAQRYKMFLRGGGNRDRARALTSPDGITWSPPIDGGTCGDRSTMFFNPFRGKWVFSLRWSNDAHGPRNGGRARKYVEADDFLSGINWLPTDPVPWARTDRLDLPDPRLGDPTALYNLDAVAYESLMLGFFEILHGPANDVNAAKGLPKNTGLTFAYSRDGFHWHRPDRRMAIHSEQRPAWDRGYVQSLGNLCTVRGDQLWFYYVGFAGDETLKLGDPRVGASSMKSGLYANGATGVATLRRDGFASMNANDAPGELVTRPLTFTGRHLFANVDAPHGTLAAEVLDATGQPIPPFTLDNCEPVRADATLAPLRWRGAGGDDLTPLAGRPVRLRFRLTRGKLYAFWVSRDVTGRSDGYVAGGGPGFTCDTDTVGRAALEAEGRVTGRH